MRPQQDAFAYPDWRAPRYRALDLAFADAALERQFMTEMLGYNKQRLLAALGAAVAVMAVNVGLDIAAYHSDLAQLRFMVTPRLIAAAMLGLLIRAVRRATSAQAIDQLAVLTAMVWIFTRTLGLIIIDPAVYTGSSMILGAIFVLYFGLPVRFSILLPVMALATSIMLGAFLRFGQPMRGEVESLVTWLCILHGLSLVSVRAIRGTLRRGYAQSLALQHMAMHDEMTGLANRRSFTARMAEAVSHAQRVREPLSVLIVDVDHFKFYNDTMGHNAGDEVLRQLGGVFESCARRGRDLACRIGGEEFALIMPETSPAGAQSIAEQLRTAVAALALRHPASPSGPYVTVSVGVASAMGGFTYAAEDLTRLADRMLYAAKTQGRDTVVAAQLRQTDVRAKDPEPAGP